MKPEYLRDWHEERKVLSFHMLDSIGDERPVEILEAGCGSRWAVDLGDLDYRLTGVDVDEDALRLRQNVRKDLDMAIVGDLRTVELEDERYDIIYCSNVIEHVDGAERVMENIVRWTRPEGIIVLIMPNGSSVKGYLTKILPHWIHVLYVRYIQGLREAGKPGHGPYPTYYDPIVSFEGVRNFCRRKGLEIVACYSAGHGRGGNLIVRSLINAVQGAVHLASGGRLTKRDHDLFFVIRKPRADQR